jgi:hypothetical protein
LAGGQHRGRHLFAGLGQAVQAHPAALQQVDEVGCAADEAAGRHFAHAQLPRDLVDLVRGHLLEEVETAEQGELVPHVMVRVAGGAQRRCDPSHRPSQIAPL